ncbi:MAG TPA: hypothetical protein VGD54_20235 [Steroidobacteraceae bacterium]
MFSVVREAVPDDALLKTYIGDAHPERWETYADCFAVSVDREVSLSDFVFAFYTSPVFRIERFILRVLVNAPSSQADARAVADGWTDEFAAWYVGERSATQLLMCDRYESTRSWFRVAPVTGGGTRLQFGTAVAAKRDENTDSPALGGGFHLLLRFHVLYSQVLLHAATVKLRSSVSPRR